MNKFLNDTNLFLEQIFINLEQAGISTRNYFLDHICYRTGSLDEYQAKKDEFEKLGKILIEAKVNGRLISTFAFNQPVIYKSYKIPMIELPAPKAGKTYQSGFEHVEFVIDESLADFIKRYSNINLDTTNINDPMNPDVKISFSDGLSVKFHVESLDKIIEKEILATLL
jgi:predicted metalloenzyme YecM